MQTLSELDPIMDVPWATVPNICTLEEYDESIEDKMTSVASFITNNNNLLLVYVRSRGWDIPGGHIDNGESIFEAAQRELIEEAGIEININSFSPFALFHIHSLLKEPRQPKYPHPNSYIGFYKADIEYVEPKPQWLHEIEKAEWVPFGEVEKRCPNCVWLPLLDLL